MRSMLLGGLLLTSMMATGQPLLCQSLTETPLNARVLEGAFDARNNQDEKILGGTVFKWGPPWRTQATNIKAQRVQTTVTARPISASSGPRTAHGSCSEVRPVSPLNNSA